MINCQVCKRKTVLYLCDDCLDQLADSLESLPWLVEQLEVTAQRQDRLTTNSVGHAATTPLPINLHAAQLARDTRAALLECAETVAVSHAGRLIPVLGSVDTADLALWLLAKISGIQRMPHAGVIYARIRHLAGDALHDGAIHTAINRQDRRYLGPCTAIVGRDHAGRPRECGHDLYAPAETTTIACPRCHTEHNPQQQLTATIKARDLVTEPQLLEALDTLGEHLPRRTLYAWIRAGKLQPRGWIHNGRIVAHRVRRGDPRVFSLSAARQLRWKDQEAKAQ